MHCVPGIVIDHRGITLLCFRDPGDNWSDDRCPCAVFGEIIVNADVVRFRLLRNDDIPDTNPHKLAYRFGLQDTKQQIVPGERRPDGTFAFDFSLNVKHGKTRDVPVFTGQFASGPVDDRFVYLSWFAIDRGDFINRVKARLSNIDWKMVRTAQAQDKAITADMTGWSPGDLRKHVEWYLS